MVKIESINLIHANQCQKEILFEFFINSKWITPETELVI